MRHAAATLMILLGSATCAVSQDGQLRPDESGARLLLIGGRHQDLPLEIRDLFFELAGGEEARIVVIPTAVADPDGTSPEDYLTPPPNCRPKSFQILHTRDRTVADDPAFVRPLAAATAVFFTNGHRHRIFDAYRGTLVEQELKKLKARGGLIAGTGRGAFVLAELLTTRAGADQLVEPGFGLLPGFLLDEGEGRLAEAVAANPAFIGMNIDNGAAAEIRGNTLRAIGEGAVTIQTALGKDRGVKLETLKAGDQSRLPLHSGHRLPSRSSQPNSRPSPPAK
jgi:cyanophycinase